MGRHGVLRVYLRGSSWWAHVPGVGRIALGLGAEVVGFLRADGA